MRFVCYYFRRFRGYPREAAKTGAVTEVRVMKTGNFSRKKIRLIIILAALAPLPVAAAFWAGRFGEGVKMLVFYAGALLYMLTVKIGFDRLNEHSEDVEDGEAG